MNLSTDQRGILRWTAVHRIFLFVALLFSSLVQTPFDSSAWIQLRLDATHSILSTSVASSLLRWDTLHFLAMASPRPLPLPAASSTSGEKPSQARGGGLLFENSLAFQPGIVWLLNYLGKRSNGDHYLTWNPSQAVLITSILATVLSVLQPVLLFSLTKKLTGDHNHAKRAAYLSILSPSPCSLITPTPESFFSFFALLGHLCISFSDISDSLAQIVMGSIFYGLATAFRANGCLFSGFLIWTIFWQGKRRRLAMALAPALILVCIWPLLLSQAFAFTRFCSRDGDWREWCQNVVPSVYTFVQDRYWCVGLFRYWTLSQLPNWALAVPTLSLASYWTLIAYSKDFSTALWSTLLPWKAARGVKAGDKLLPHAHFTLITLFILLFKSHVQVALRFASPGGLPAVWWGASYLLLDRKRTSSALFSIAWADFVVGYLVLWNLASIVLYAGFYPPA